MQDELRQHFLKAYEANELATIIVLGDRLLAQSPADGPVLYRVGDALSAMRQYGLAEHYLNAALKIAPESKRHVVLWRLGNLCERRGEFEKAIEYFNAAACDEPDDATYYIFQGSLLAKLGRLEEAEAMHRRATSCSEGCIDEAYYNLGLIYRSQRRFDDARNCLEIALEIDPEYQEALKVLQDVHKAIRLMDDSSG